MNRNFHIGFKFFKRRIILTSEIVVIYKYDLITSFWGGLRLVHIYELVLFFTNLLNSVYWGMKKVQTCYMNVYVTVLIIYNLVIQKHNYRNIHHLLQQTNIYKFSLLFGSECCRQAALNDFIDSYQGLILLLDGRRPN